MSVSRAYTVSPTDRTGLLVITETLFMSWMVLVSLIRLYMRTVINGPLHLDDLAALIGSVIGVAHTGVIMDSVSHGFGRSETESSPSSLARAAQVRGPGLFQSNLLFLAGHGAAKISVCLLLKRLSRQRSFLRWANAITAVAATWMVASILAAGISCPPQLQWTVREHCNYLGTTWKVISTLDSITELLLFALSVFLVWAVQMRRKEKFMVIFAFGTRVPIISLITLRQMYLDHSLLLDDAPLHLSGAVIATAVLLHCSIMVSTVPCLKPFVIAFNTGWGQGTATSTEYSHSYFTPAGKSASSSQSRAYATTREEDELELTVARPSASDNDQRARHLVIQETREWTIEESFEMQSMEERV